MKYSMYILASFHHEVLLFLNFFEITIIQIQKHQSKSKSTSFTFL